MSLLTICQDVANEVGFDEPATIIDNTDQIARQLLRMCNRSGETLSQLTPPWQILVEEGSVTLATSDQDYALPSDFRYIIPDTTWNRTTDRMVVNPIGSAEWQYFKAWSTVSGLNLRARIRNNQLEFEQTITSGMNGETVYFEYVSKYWCSSDGSTKDQQAFAADTDVSLIDEELITMDVIWRFKKAKGLDDWKVDYEDFERMRKIKQGRDTGSRSLDMGGDHYGHILGVNVPDRDL